MTANSRCSAAEPPGLETQRREIESLLREWELRAGDSWYVVERRWYEQWKEFVETETRTRRLSPVRSTTLSCLRTWTRTT
ncbi:hypothetical protein PBY51_001056 [Eleginops maclovinus]|uniref:ubiquitinyl hydrolase 1 n=1 Tax=Eleginops maclovinus TaxID=56733 RepID=A0AAN8AR09_ELEMC|nr:hypothetical protein PBY51_001056 [Eleginops maclovinus]